MAIPVYLFTGFLEAGKTTFVQETLEDPEFNTGEKTLLLLCEEGEAEYSPERFAGGNVEILSLETEAELCVATLKEYQRKHRLDRVVIEYNGMWKLQTLYDALPKDWEIYQMICIADTSTFENYLNNMRPSVIDKLREPEVVLFNRCTQQTDRIYLHRTVRAVNRRAQIIFEFTDGTIVPDDFVEELPWDKTTGKIVLEDQDFGIWYLDAIENPEKYKGRSIVFRGYVCQSEQVPEGCFAAGRFAMTCCEDDIAYMGVLCSAPNANEYAHRSWVMIEAEMDICDNEIYQGKGVFLKAINVQPTQPPEEELVYFFR